MKERMNYIIPQEGYYIGTFVNHGGIIIQADSLEDLKEKANTMFRFYLDHLIELFAQPEPFEFKEQTMEEWDSQYHKH